MVQATPFDGPVSVGLNFVRYFDDYDDDSDFGFLMSLGAWIEHYDIDDDPTSGTRIYMPAAFFLVPNDADYEGNVAFVRTRYRW